MARSKGRKGYECHGGPWDGEFHAVADPFTAVELDLGQVNHIAHISKWEDASTIPPRRVGVYVVAKYLPPRGGEPEMVLKWKGEEIRNG